MPENALPKVRICYSISNFIPNYGGAEQFAADLAFHAVRGGFAVSLITRAVPSAPKCELLNGVKIIRGIHTIDLGPLFGLAYLVSCFFSMLFTVGNADLLYAHFLYFNAVVMALFARLTGKPALVQLHGSGKFGDIASLKAIKGGRFLLRFILNSGVRFIAISTAIRDELLAEGCASDRILQIPVGVDVSEFFPAVNKQLLRRDVGFDGFSVVFVGRLAEQKGIGYLLEAWAQLKKIRKRSLYIVGRGPLAEELREKAVRLGIGDSVVFTGWVGDIRPYLKAADVYVLPSLAEGMPASLLEAMACGAACVGTTIGGTEDVIVTDRNGLLVPSASVDGLVRALSYLYENPLRAVEMGRQARLTVETYHDSNKLFDLHCRVYKEILVTGHFPTS